MSEISGQGEEGWYMYKKRLNILFISPGSAVSETNFLRKAKISSKVEFEGDPWCMLPRKSQGGLIYSLICADKTVGVERSDRQQLTTGN